MKKQNAKVTTKTPQLRLDLQEAEVQYVSQFRIEGNAEEVFIDLAPFFIPRPQAGEIIMPVKTRLAMNYFSAKRLQLALQKTIEDYQKKFGTIEVDRQKRDLVNTVKSTTNASFPKIEFK